MISIIFVIYTILYELELCFLNKFNVFKQIINPNLRIINSSGKTILFLRETSQFVYQEFQEKYSDIEVVKKNELEKYLGSKSGVLRV